MSVLFFSNTSRDYRPSKTVLLGTTAFIFSALFSASSAFAEDAYVSECVGCGKGQYLADTLTALSEGGSSYDSNVPGQIQTSGLAADEFDTGLSAKSVSASNGNYDYNAQEGNALLDLLESDSGKSTKVTDSQRQVYVPASANANPVAKAIANQTPKTEAFKEASLNISSDEERYLRNGSSYLTSQAPAQQVKAAPVFDDYVPYMDGVRVAPISTYKAATAKPAKPAAVTESAAVVSAAAPKADTKESQAKPSVVSASEGEEVSSVVKPVDNFVLSPTPTPAFADSLKTADNSISSAPAEIPTSQVSPLEALLLSDEVAAPEKTGNEKQTSYAGSNIPAFSDSLNKSVNENKTKSESENANLLTPMDGGLYAYAGSSKEEEETYGGAVNSVSTDKSVSGGYGTDYASFVPASGYAPVKSSAYSDGPGAASDNVFPVVVAKPEKPAEKGIIDKLKDWFNVSDNSSAAPRTAQPVVVSTPAADTVDEILARYAGKNKQRADSQMPLADPSAIAVVFEENSANASAKTVRRLGDFAESAARSKNSVVRVQVSKVNLSLQAKRFALIKSILMSNGISLDRIRPSVDGESPDTVILRFETPIYTIGGYEKIEAMGG